jgi:hypothetical protein
MPNPYLTGDERAATAARLRKRYETGDTIRGLVALTGRSYGAVRDLLLEAGTAMRPHYVRPRL